MSWNIFILFIYDLMFDTHKQLVPYSTWLHFIIRCLQYIYNTLFQCTESSRNLFTVTSSAIQVNLDMTDSMGPGKLARHMQNPSYTYDEYLICIGLGPSISFVICKNLSYSGPLYPSSPVLRLTHP